MATNWQIGDRIQNRWEIHKILRGGMGIVYIVYDHEWHEALAAKTFQDEIFARNPAIAQRFTQEALTWVNLDVHQNIAQARYVQSIEDKPYLFLEYVSGGDLSNWIGTLRLTRDLPQVLRFAIHLCGGMIHALSKGIKAHRDIKPQNCLVTEDNTLKVTDFGLAKVFDDASRADIEMPGGVGLTRAGMGMGTPPYMAPEQFDDAKRVDVRADVYSFGVMLFQMLTGQLPFAGRTWEEYKRLHKTQQPPALSAEHLTLKNVIETCLAKDSVDRFADFGAVRQELADICEKLTGETPPEPMTGVELSAAELSNKGVSLNELGRLEEAIECYDRALEINPHLAEAWSNKGSSLSKLGRPEEEIKCYDRALEINPHYAEAWTNKGNALGRLGRSEEAVECYDRALQINPRRGVPWTNKGNALGRLGRSEEAIECYNRALEINPRYAEAWTNKGNVLDSLGRLEEAIECYDRALETNARYSEVWSNKGNTLDSLGRSEEAIECYDHALEINPGRGEVWSNKGVALDNLGASEEAIECHNRALEINPRDEAAWSNKGLALANLDSLKEAIECHNRALEINPRYAEAWDNKGLTLAKMGFPEEAIEYHDRALEINPRYAKAWNNKGVTLGSLGRSEEKIKCYDRALEINPRYAEAWYNKGAALGNAGRIRQALACFEKAFQFGDRQAAHAIAMCRRTLGII